MSIAATSILSLLLHLLALRATASAVTITVTAAPTIPSEEPSYSKRYMFTSAVLNSTNTYRRQHAAAALGWNVTLAAFARTYLDAAHSDNCSFEHSGGPYGENIAIGYTNATAAVAAWGDERREYNFARPGFDHVTGHFTQLVWRDTTTVGCERVLCGARGWFVACEYWPPGNVQGHFGDEVQRQVENGARSRGSSLGAAVLALAAVVWQVWA
ncbi:Allergen V5/Tpx-1-related protein [Cordyceps fumosorosea ARSEF 2679]|uniref:Allergen V5/Tpx-1-related protein n=1 Tax=Cordyceps fumosorosea (strain ARSEF 2679) TaxID=1081104 RepID=A0A167Q486_CORFA|nr:Allergen V5/Tpx-1-related protein [Cordyceps fumosorosea ARSEF 2679]OAA57271.1 Allergen V5/Tpx-1-related protein [Cordyceps fumosorosea ARSEF 2679]